MKNAIILAAGKSSSFAPFTYEKPKGLFRVNRNLIRFADHSLGSFEMENQKW